MKEKSEKVEELEKKLANHNKTITRNIAKKREEASIYYEKANILVELDKSIKDESRLNDALKCYDSAIILAPKKSIYLADRSKLHVLLGNNDLAVEDIRKLKSLSRDNDYVLETYIKNTVEEITRLDAIQDTVNKLLTEGKIDKELAGALNAHADITARLVVQVGMQKEELIGFRKEINELKILVINLQETIKLSNKETIKLKWELKQKTDELEMQLQIIKDIETLGKENPALYSYYNTFYWNIKSFITAYEVASTNVVQKNTDKEATTASKAIFETTSLAVKAAGIA